MSESTSLDSSQGFNSPLMCWDLFIEGYDAKMGMAADRADLIRMASSNHWKHNFDFESELFRCGNTIIVTDPSILIVLATRNMFKMNGYLPQEVIGKKPSMFQGEGTSKETTRAIRNAINQRQHFEATLVNYRKNGEAYPCFIRGYPVFNKSGELVNFIAFESELTEK
ncbi:PAS domain-containing protein [Pollutibacter soli]|uniref:PAS domain-containing protein n=1 Tax=Pollutibacter soli TaxID=3034157 RepID=UPI003013E22B